MKNMSIRELLRLPESGVNNVLITFSTGDDLNLVTNYKASENSICNHTTQTHITLMARLLHKINLPQSDRKIGNK